MTKNILLFALMVWTTTLFGQQFKGGLTAGLVGSQVAGDNFSGYKKAGLFAGGFVTLSLSPTSSLQMELTYFQKGSRENPTEDNNYVSYLLRVNYIELPLLYQYHAGRFVIEAGPSGGFLAGYYEEDNYNVGNDINSMSRITLQINLGVALQLSSNWSAFLRTNDSLFNIRKQNKDGDVHRFWDYGQYNDALILGIRYLI
jgi:hypothetical protein